jgi:hypothetical protein
LLVLHLSLFFTSVKSSPPFKVKCHFLWSQVELVAHCLVLWWHSVAVIYVWVLSASLVGARWVNGMKDLYMFSFATVRRAMLKHQVYPTCGLGRWAGQVGKSQIHSCPWYTCEPQLSPKMVVDSATKPFLDNMHKNSTEGQAHNKCW